MFQVEYRDAEGRRRVIMVVPDELFELIRTMDERHMTLCEIWKVSQGYMGRCYVIKKKNRIELRDSLGDLIEARVA